MLSVVPLKSAQGAADYYAAAFNYYAGDAQALRWLGRGCLRLGLSGVVEKEAMLALLEGRLSNGQVLQNKTGTHRPGFDMTFSAPKSVSILVGLRADAELETLHDLAVEKAIEYIEKEFAQTRLVIDGKVHYVNTGNLVVAAFRQPSSRANDPAMHTHCVTMNMTFLDEEGKARSLASDIHGHFGVIEQLQQQVTYAGLLYRTVYANLLKDRGYRLREAGKGLFEIEGISEDVLNEFSTRRSDIEAKMEEEGWEGARLASKATLLTRNAKEEHDINVLRADWQKRAERLGFNAKEFVERQKALTQSLDKPGFFSTWKENLFSRFYEKPDLEVLQAKEAVFVAIEAIAQQESVFEQRRLKEAALRHTLTGKSVVTIEAIEKAIEATIQNQCLYKAIDPKTNKNMLTTPWGLTLETETLARMERNREIVTPLACPHAVNLAQKAYEAASSFSLTASQKMAMLHVFTTQDRFNAIQGYAGSGKTTLLKLTAQLAVQKGFNVRGLAVTSSAVNELRAKACIHADVYPIVQQELLRAKVNSLSKTLFILDEASMLSTIQGHELIKLIEQKGARLFLVGDEAQLSSVKCGRIFGQLQDYGIQTSQMTDIIRQTNRMAKQSVKDAIAGEYYNSLQKLDEVREIKTHEERIDTIAKRWLSLSSQVREKTLLFAPTHANRREITHLIREGLKKEGTLQGKAIILNTLKAKTMEEIHPHYVQYYQTGDVLRFNIRLPQSRIQPGDYFTVGLLTEKHRKNKTIPLVNGEGKSVLLQLKELPHYQPTRAGLNRPIEFYESATLELCQHDQIMVTRNHNPSGLINSSLALVKSIDEKSLTLTFEDGQVEKMFPLNSDPLKHVDHGYVLTTMKVQGKDKPYAIGLMESYNQFSATLKQYYVQISRAISSMTLITDDKTQLLKALEMNDDTKKTALGHVATDTVNTHQNRFSGHVNALPIAGVIEQKRLKEQDIAKQQGIVQNYAMAKQQGKSSIAAYNAYQLLADPTLRRMARLQLGTSESVLRQDALKYATVKRLQGLTHEEREKLLRVKAYVDACQQTQKAWHSVHHGNQSPLQKNIAWNKAARRNALAHAIAQQVEDYKPYLCHFSIGTLNRFGVSQYRIEKGEEQAIQRLKNLSLHAEKHQLILDVTAFFNEAKGDDKERLAVTLKTQSKAIHPYLVQFSEHFKKPLDGLWREINKHAKVFEDKAFRAKLNAKEKHVFDQIQSYKALHCELAIQYSSTHYLLEQGKEIPESFAQKQREITILRNHFATVIKNNLSLGKLFNYFKIDQDKIKKHALSDDKYQTVLRFKQSQANFKLKKEAALTIADDIKGHYPFIKALHVNTKTLNMLMRIEVRLAHFNELNETQKADYLKLIDYKVTSRKAGAAWKSIFAAKEEGRSLSEFKITQAQQLTAKRDSLAFELKEKPELQTFIAQERLDLAKMAIHAKQHGARLKTITQLSTTKEKLLAQLEGREPKMNRYEARTWHKTWVTFNQQLRQVYCSPSLYQSAIDKAGKSPFVWSEPQKALLSQYELNAHLTQEPAVNPSIKGRTINNARSLVQKEVFDATRITEALLANPEETYRAIFGEPKKITSKEMRYSGGLIVSLKGSKAGFWYDFSEGTGGNPIQALMRERGLSFQDALKEGAVLSGTHGTASREWPLQRARQTLISAAEEDKNKIISAKSIIQGGVPIQGTLAHRYLKEHRGIEKPEMLNVFFWPKGALWQATDDNGKLYEKINKIPALLIAAKNEKGEITGVQRVYLDEKTAKKNTFMENAKLSKGKIEGSAGILQKGDKLSTLYLVEGPETGASVAMANPKATVLVSFGLANLKNLANLIKGFHPHEVIIAGDNDNSVKSKTLTITKEAQALLKTEGIDAKLIIPQSISGREKTDWNDVHISQGLREVKQQLNLFDKNQRIHEIANELRLETASKLENYTDSFNQIQHPLLKNAACLEQKNEQLKSTYNNLLHERASAEKSGDINQKGSLKPNQKNMDFEI